MKKFSFNIIAISILIAVCYLFSCTHKPQLPPADGNYPPEIAGIMMNKCAISGCHNAASYQNANALLLDSWDHLLQGGLNGADVVAYSPVYSPLVYICNPDTTNGSFYLKPTMPLSTPGRYIAPLTSTEYKTLYNWVAKGAPDKNGNIPFSSNPSSRQKMYITQSASDIIAVIDGQSKLVMRYINVGVNHNEDFQHDIAASADGRYIYISLFTGDYMQKIDANIDTVVATVNLSSGSQLSPGSQEWSILLPSPVDTAILVTNYYGINSGFAMINTTNMKVDLPYALGIPNAHGIASNRTFDTFFVTSQFGNSIYKYCNKNPYELLCVPIPIKGSIPSYSNHATAPLSPDPHQIEMAPDFSKYFVTCQQTNEVRVIDAHTDKVLDSIVVGNYPQEMAISESRNLLFVACTNDSNANTLPGRYGSVYIIDLNTNHVIKVLNGDFYEPHDIAVDEQDGYVYIASWNRDSKIPICHPIPGSGGGKNPGWYSVYNLNTLEPADKKRYEVLFQPYAITNRF